MFRDAKFPLLHNVIIRNEKKAVSHQVVKYPEVGLDTLI